MPHADKHSGSRHFYYQGRKRTLCGLEVRTLLKPSKESRSACRQCETAQSNGPLEAPEEGLLLKPKLYDGFAGVRASRTGLPLLVGTRIGALALLGDEAQFERVYKEVLVPGQTAARRIAGIKGLFDDGVGSSSMNTQAAKALALTLSHLAAQGASLD